jgi:tetratricopeptide (TPR) repeat protein
MRYPKILCAFSFFLLELGSVWSQEKDSFLDILLPYLNHSSPVLRQEALISLAHLHIKNPSHLSPTFQSLLHSESILAVRLELLHTLAKLKIKGMSSEVLALLDEKKNTLSFEEKILWTLALLPDPSEKLPQVLLSYLKSPHSPLSEQAYQTYLHLAYPLTPLVDELILNLENNNDHIRRQTLVFLGRLEEQAQTALPSLLKMLSPLPYALQVKTVEVLGKIRDPRALPHLRQILNRRNPPLFLVQTLIAIERITNETSFSSEWFEKYEKAEEFLFQGHEKYEENDLEGALQCYNKSIGFHPTFAEAYYSRGSTKYSLRINRLDGEENYYIEEARKDYEDAIFYAPQYARGYYGRGLIYYYEKKLTLAMKDYQKAIELEPTFADAYYCLGVIEYEQSFYAKAIEYYHKALQYRPEMQDAYYARGLAYYYSNQEKKAEVDFIKYLESLEPQETKAEEKIEENSSLQWIFTKLPHLKKKWEAFKKAKNKK